MFGKCMLVIIILIQKELFAFEVVMKVIIYFGSGFSFLVLGHTGTLSCTMKFSY